MTPRAWPAESVSLAPYGISSRVTETPALAAASSSRAARARKRPTSCFDFIGVALASALDRARAPDRLLHADHADLHHGREARHHLDDPVLHERLHPLLERLLVDLGDGRLVLDHRL